MWSPQKEPRLTNWYLHSRRLGQIPNKFPGRNKKYNVEVNGHFILCLYDSEIWPEPRIGHSLEWPNKPTEHDRREEGTAVSDDMFDFGLWYPRSNQGFVTWIVIMVTYLQPDCQFHGISSCWAHSGEEKPITHSHEACIGVKLIKEKSIHQFPILLWNCGAQKSAFGTFTLQQT